MPKLKLKRPKAEPAPVVADPRRPVHMRKEMNAEHIVTWCGIRMTRPEASTKQSGLVLTSWESGVTCPRCKLPS